MPLDDNRKAQDGRRIAERYWNMVTDYKELKPGDWVEAEESLFWVCECREYGRKFNYVSFSRCFECDMNRPPLPDEKDAVEVEKDTE